MRRSKRSMVCVVFKCKIASFVFQIIGAYRTHTLVHPLQHRLDNLICAPISKRAAPLLWYTIEASLVVSAISYAFSSDGRYLADANPLPDGRLLTVSFSRLLVTLPKTTRLSIYVSNIKGMLPIQSAVFNHCARVHDVQLFERADFAVAGWKFQGG
jgi:hypothetical protein